MPDDRPIVQVSATTSQWGRGMVLQVGNDWRVPTLKELQSTVEYCRAGGVPATTPAINVEVFPDSTSTFVWSSSPVVNDASTSLAWPVNFGDGSDDGKSRTDTYPMRLVRGGL